MLLISLYRLNLLVSKANRQHILYRIIFKKMIHVTCEQPHLDDVKHIFVHTSTNINNLKNLLNWLCAYGNSFPTIRCSWDEKLLYTLSLNVYAILKKFIKLKKKKSDKHANPIFCKTMHKCSDVIVHQSCIKFFYNNILV